MQVSKEEFNRSGVIEDCCDLLKGTLSQSPLRPPFPEADSEYAAAARAVVVAAAALLSGMVVSTGAGAEEICQGNQWRAARAHAMEANRLLAAIPDPDPRVAQVVLGAYIGAEAEAGRPLPADAIERALALEEAAPLANVGDRVSASPPGCRRQK